MITYTRTCGSLFFSSCRAFIDKELSGCDISVRGALTRNLHRKRKEGVRLRNLDDLEGLAIVEPGENDCESLEKIRFSGILLYV